MNIIRLWAAIVICSITGLTVYATEKTNTTDIYLSDLTCEYLINPLCIQTDQPRLGWKISSITGTQHGRIQTAYQIMVASTKDLLFSGKPDLWDSGKIYSNASSQVAYAGNTPEPCKKCYWRVRVWTNLDEISDWSETAFWGTAPGDLGAKWIGDKPDTKLHEYLEYVYSGYPDGIFDEKKWKNPPTQSSPLLRKKFIVSKGIKSATLYATSLGYYEMWLNGNRIGESVLAPEYTDYNLRLQYQTYDVTEMLRKGDNAICATLADGWALGRLAGVKWMHNFPHRGFYANDRRLIAKLLIEYSDGKTLEIPTDSTWKLNTDGYIINADNFSGETIDARLLDKKWIETNFDDTDWDNAFVDDSIQRNIVPQTNEPITVHTVLSPQKIWKHDGKWMVDFGQNIAGFCNLQISGEKGDEITIRHGEWLNDDGSLYTQSLGYAKATDKFILSGNDDTFTPTMTYHGFQYVEVSGLKEDLRADQINAHAISSSSSIKGKFKCSNHDLNKLYENIVWTQHNNMLSVLTDNPSRDERTGAMGDIQIFAQTSIFNMDMAAFYTKYIYDMMDVAHNGQFYSMIPSLFNGESWQGWIGAPGWCEAAMILPWRLYENYADTRSLEILYDKMCRHIDATVKENPDLIWRKRHNHNGDWLNANSVGAEVDPSYNTRNGAMPDDVFATAFLAYSTKLLSDIAEVLHKPADHDKYSKLAHEIKNVFIKSFIDETGKIDGECQGAYSLALYYDLVPDELRVKCFDNLLKCIKDYDYRLSTGFITTPMMMQILTDFGRTDVAYKLLTSDRFPSWLHMVHNGASTVWERWDAWIPGKGFQNPTMNSLDHVAFGAVGEWMFRNILGINPDVENPGYYHFFIKPHIGGNLSWAEGSYDSMRGLIKSSWKTEGSNIKYEFTIPENSTATIVLQAGKEQKIYGAYNHLFSRRNDAEISALLGSGTYSFEVR